MAKQSVLLVDDDTTLLELLSDHVRMAGYRCLTASTGMNGLELATAEQPNLIVLDVMMPDVDGWEICKRLRATSNIPIIMLTAKSEEFDKLHGFRLGVDDYVTKPFSFAEMVARIGAVLARSQTHPDSNNRQIISGDLVIDFDQHRVTVVDNVIDLTPTEYRLLEVLARYINRTVSTEQLLDEVWGSAYDQVDQVKHFVWSLRKKIERDPGDPEHILTERGYGYRFE
ncbi:MAG: response regulator transcription factor [Anaerolineae bacterium]|nr:response regulator transcription factor [Anaerolineae bacterium]